MSSKNPLIDRIATLHAKYQKVTKPFTDEEKDMLMNELTFHSNKIEGLELNYGDTIKYLTQGTVVKGANLKDLYDLTNHKKILSFIFDNHPTMTRSVETLKIIHKVLMEDPRQWSMRNAYSGGPGVFKQENNGGNRGNQEYKEYLPWNEVPKAMDKYFEEFNREFKKEPLLALADLQYTVLNEIHPFGDGNGRSVRLFVNMCLLQKDFPVFNVLDTEKKAYITSIVEQEKNPRSNSFQNFFFNKVEKALNQKLKKGMTR